MRPRIEPPPGKLRTVASQQATDCHRRLLPGKRPWKVLTRIHLLFNIINSMDGEVYFVYAATLTKGNIPYLPVEIREHIKAMTYPKIRKRCRACDNVVLLESENKSLFQVRPFTIIDDVCSCMSCVKSPRVILPSFVRHILSSTSARVTSFLISTFLPQLN